MSFYIEFESWVWERAVAWEGRTGEWGCEAEGSRVESGRDVER
jgi:hypothetical protein